MYFAWNPVIGGGVRGLFRDDIFLHQYVSFIWNQKHVSVKWHIFFSENDALEVFGIFAWCKSQLFLCGVPGSMNFQMWVMAWYSGQPWSNTAGVRAQCGLLIVCWNKKEPKTAPKPGGVAYRCPRYPAMGYDALPLFLFLKYNNNFRHLCRVAELTPL